ncbi:MAG TPA: hypothetical protein VFZ65_11440 [Planctomycetota bacterium]|nr:hypothetical protein [Planctomycetota bacterium]
MPLRFPTAANLLLLIAATTCAIDFYRDAAAFDATTIGNDAASLYLRKFARLRADLPAGASVRCIGEERELGAAEQGLFDVYAVAVRAHLAGAAIEPQPGVDAAYVKQIAEGYLAEDPDAKSRDVAEVRAFLVDWWKGLARGLELGLERFVLAPHLVREKGSTDFVVGDFTEGYDYTSQAAREGLTVVHDFGGGAVLFRAGR